jgi:glycosyltransferase involved in cell wall biosynthesis
LFVDQRWVDLVPARFSSTYIHRDPGCDVAYWNLYNRHIVYQDGGYTVNGQSLKFYHFSGFSPERPKQISKHQTRYTFKDLPVLNMLFDGYKACLYDHGYETVKGWPYSYDVRDGRVIRIPDVARALWRDMELDALTWASEEAERGVVMGMLDWLNQPVDQPKQGQALVTRLALAVYQRRPDLQRAFPDVLGRDRIPYVRWLVNTGKKELSLDDFFTEPMVSDLTRLSGSRDLLRQQGVKAGLYQTFANWLFRVGLGARIERLLGQRIVSGVRNFFTGSRVLRSASQPLPELGTPQVVQGAQDGQADQAGGQGQGVNVVGYLCDETGVGESARTTMRALHDQGYPVARTMVKSDTARKNDRSVMHFPKGHPHGVNLFYVNADQMNVVYEELGPSFFADKYNIAYWAWELDRFPDAWLDRFQHLDEIWVGSRFVQNTLAHVAPIPVIIMGVGIDKKSDTHINRAALGLPQTKFLFLFAFDMLSFIERKNPLGAIEAYRRAFGTHSKDTALVIKVTNLDRFPEHRAPLEKGVASVGGILIDGYLDRPELDGLFSACDAYVSLHRSEGFGMTIAESMCLGKPVIATSYSGNADYMNVNNSYPVKYDLIELTQDYGPYQKGGVWADPDLDHAAAQMRRVFEHPDQARLKGARAAADIAREYSHAAMGRKMARRLALVAGLK